MSYRQAFSAFYARNFERRPWVTLAVTNGILGVVADSVAQSLELVSRRQKLQDSQSGKQVELRRELEAQRGETGAGAGGGGWDFARNGRFLAFNVGMAPILAEWNRFIEHRFPLRVPAAGAVAGQVGEAVKSAGRVSAKALVKRVATDQILFAPFGLVMFVGSMGLMERGTIQGTKDKFSEMYASALLANWQVWPLVQLVNFRYMPLKYRVPFTSTVGILWTIGLSLLSQATSTRHQVEQQQQQRATGVAAATASSTADVAQKA
ncbi:uncharacterized protein PFL1_01211 [Pseudozyma flocculosa PF-1]|uniref:Related to SYM1 - protein required for ethanol metabolism n=1 Tax=Pseudozyma flocculosa TaxID=84751 RepID=A0A5C3EUZ8_9BASI|nr:uncharacterized protein PFL1_01211 [Pseudozyma flocculosa PF-1]EPQ31022.1 hypothetical protein PFL1_01211 [Pseudozyma flocculosa PF-1]SPO35862.1 related to SYM1 - protein required for ethanol metabolism [Pseudozyma flocculosa]